MVMRSELRRNTSQLLTYVVAALGLGHDAATHTSAPISLRRVIVFVAAHVIVVTVQGL